MTSRHKSSRLNVKPKHAFSMDFSPSVLKNDDPLTIDKPYWAKFKPGKSVVSTTSSTAHHRHLHQLIKVEQACAYSSLIIVQETLTGAITNYASQEINPSARQKCFQWLINISETRKADPNVVFHSMVLFDRVLISREVPQTCTQLIAAASYLIASKLRETCPVDPAKMQEFGDGFCDANDVIETENFILQCLNWNIDAVTPVPYLQTLASNLVCVDLVGPMVEKSLDCLYKCAARESLCGTTSSLLACSALLYTMTSCAVPSQIDYVSKFHIVDYDFG